MKVLHKLINICLECPYLHRAGIVICENKDREIRHLGKEGEMERVGYRIPVDCPLEEYRGQEENAFDFADWGLSG